ncbi:hypothetical protein CEP53_003919 [Fusarium sp. AF-6]|nr:hypothetical protein CEP53_003919 [Fusarium sp. AF-6]
MEAIRWDPKTLLQIDVRLGGRQHRIHCVSSPAGDLSQRCGHTIPEPQCTKALQLIDTLSKKRLEEINPSHLDSLVFQCLCLHCQPQQHEQVSYAWARTIEASVRHQDYLMASFEEIHRAECSSLVAQLDTETELVWKFKEQNFANQESFALYQDALEIGKKEAKRQEEKIHFLEMENISLKERVEEDLAAQYEDSFVNKFLGGKGKDNHDPPLLTQAEINDMHHKTAFLTTKIERLSKQNDALEKDLEMARGESETLRDSEKALVQRLKCQHYALQKVQWQLKYRADFEQVLNRLEAILNALEKDMIELVAEGELGVVAERELEELVIMEREDHHVEELKYRRKLRKERARNMALIERVKALELLQVQMNEEMEGNWLYWIWKAIQDPGAWFRRGG